jgi:hypothetical protein
MRTLGLLAVSTLLAAAPVLGTTSAADAAILRHTGDSAILGHAAILQQPAILGNSAILGHGAILRGGTVPYKWKNCTIVNHRLPHGVGRANAHDATSGTPVTNFRHDTAMYKAAMSANKGLDRDKDGIACEKR